ncbi:MAG: response regulator [Verrucomicrobia bacterium]|nr:response regulator [Verrucomicrobiota bacterium]
MGMTLTTDQIASYCGVRRKTVTEWIRSGKLPSISRPGQGAAVRQQDFIAFLRHRGEPIPVDFIEDNRHRVLIVDDDAVVVRTLTGMFDTFIGCSVKTALDGVEAGMRLATFRPHLVVLDLNMPRVDGYTVCAHIKADPATTGTTVLVITGDGSEQTIERLLASGADGYLVKPIRLKDLQHTVTGLLDEIHVAPASPAQHAAGAAEGS